MNHLPELSRRPAPTRLLAAGLGAVALLLLLAAPEALVAQAEQLGQQRLGRPYWHVFLAYAIGWILILGWIVSIARRLRQVESRLADDRE